MLYIAKMYLLVVTWLPGKRGGGVKMASTRGGGGNFGVKGVGYTIGSDMGRPCMAPTH